MTIVSNKLMTAEELLMLPKGDGRRFELIRGVLIEKMPTGDPHGESVVLFTMAVGNYAQSNRQGVVRSGDPGCWLDRDPDTVRAPDVAWFAPGLLPRGRRGYPALNQRWRFGRKLEKLTQSSISSLLGSCLPVNTQELLSSAVVTH